jgi:hypothetical protein
MIAAMRKNHGRIALENFLMGLGRLVGAR